MDLPALRVDLATMTGGRLVFESRDPADRGWEEWTREASFRRLDLPTAGIVESWVELTDVALPLVSSGGPTGSTAMVRYSPPIQP
jgi:hypothetical protein